MNDELVRQHPQLRSAAERADDHVHEECKEQDYDDRAESRHAWTLQGTGRRDARVRARVAILALALRGARARLAVGLARDAAERRRIAVAVLLEAARVSEGAGLANRRRLVAHR